MLSQLEHQSRLRMYYFKLFITQQTSEEEMSSSDSRMQWLDMVITAYFSILVIWIFLFGVAIAPASARNILARSDIHHVRLCLGMTFPFGGGWGPLTRQGCMCCIPLVSSLALTLATNFLIVQPVIENIKARLNSSINTALETDLTAYKAGFIDHCVQNLSRSQVAAGPTGEGANPQKSD